MVLIDHLKRRRSRSASKKEAKKEAKKGKQSAIVKSVSNHELHTPRSEGLCSDDGKGEERKSRAHSMAFMICDSDEDLVIVHSLDNINKASSYTNNSNTGTEWNTPGLLYNNNNIQYLYSALSLKQLKIFDRHALSIPLC